MAATLVGQLFHRPGWVSRRWRPRWRARPGPGSPYVSGRTLKWLKVSDPEEAQSGAQTLGFRLQVWTVGAPKDLEAFAGMRRERAEALMTLADPVFTA
jgi:hypothetical protein